MGSGSTRTATSVSCSPASGDASGASSNTSGNRPRPGGAGQRRRQSRRPRRRPCTCGASLSDLDLQTIRQLVGEVKLHRSGQLANLPVPSRNVEAPRLPGSMRMRHRHAATLTDPRFWPLKAAENESQIAPSRNEKGQAGDTSRVIGRSAAIGCCPSTSSGWAPG